MWEEASWSALGGHFRELGIDADAVFTHPLIRPWRMLDDRENCLLDAELRDGRRMSGTIQMRREQWTDDYGQHFDRYVMRTTHWIPSAPEPFALPLAITSPSIMLAA